MVAAVHSKGSARTYPTHFPPYPSVRGALGKENTGGVSTMNAASKHHRGPLVTSNTHTKDRRLALWRSQVGLASRGSQP